ncbi:hypothetical protein VZC37_02070 [Gordonia sp. LSe1-13]|uniref:Transmembrane protein n=1 Tax=Gordonia sesuvii TaxID=3116777 RepID=A0ABU7M7S8_9ACTN|nr:hypothetical protein [Gordonia sp. LSe1-13]
MINHEHDTTEHRVPVGRAPELRQAVIHGIVTIAAALVILWIAGVSDGGVRVALIVAAPIVVLIGALAALWRTYRNWRGNGRWQIWQGASWFLLAMFIFFLSGIGPVLSS